jgi:hypothetical protein
MPAAQAARESPLAGRAARPLVSAGGRQEHLFGRVGPSTQAAPGAMRPGVGDTDAGYKVRALRSLPAALAPSMVSAVRRAELPRVSPHRPRFAGGAVSLRLCAAALLSGLVCVGHVLDPPPRHALFR